MGRTRARRRRLGLTVTVALVAAAWAGPVAGAVQGDDGVPVARSTVVVVDGDTLWAIAERVAPGQDPRPLVDAISRVNAVSAGAIVPGQTLVVPAG